MGSARAGAWAHRAARQCTAQTCTAWPPQGGRGRGGSGMVGLLTGVDPGKWSIPTWAEPSGPLWPSGHHALPRQVALLLVLAHPPCCPEENTEGLEWQATGPSLSGLLSAGRRAEVHSSGLGPLSRGSSHCTSLLKGSWEAGRPQPWGCCLWALTRLSLFPAL